MCIQELAVNVRKDFATGFDNFLTIIGGMITDNVTMKVHDKQFYDLTLHYFLVEKSISLFSSNVSVNFRTLLLIEVEEAQTAAGIRSLL